MKIEIKTEEERQELLRALRLLDKYPLPGGDNQDMEQNLVPFARRGNQASLCKKGSSNLPLLHIVLIAYWRINKLKLKDKE